MTFILGNKTIRTEKKDGTIIAIGGIRATEQQLQGLVDGYNLTEPFSKEEVLAFYEVALRAMTEHPAYYAQQLDIADDEFERMTKKLRAFLEDGGERAEEKEA